MSTFVFLYPSLFFSVIYCVSLYFNKIPYAWLMKGLSTLLLGFFVLFSLQNKVGFILFLAFLFSSIGDVFLGINRNRLFFNGLISFTVAHLFYIYVFYLYMPLPVSLSWVKILLIIIVLISQCFMLRQLSPHLGKLKTAVFVYIFVLGITVFSAITADLLHPFVLIGTLLFAFSDSLISKEKFLRPFKGIGYLIWICYYLGQLMIALGIMRS